MRKLAEGQGRYAVGGTAALLVLAVAFILGSCTPTRNAPVKAGSKSPTDKTAVADTYAGVESCKECHQKSFASFSDTKMGRVFLKAARTPGEAQGCETCHGPSKSHVDTGGKIVGGLITFTTGSTTPVAERNDVCLKCHTKGARVFWEGSPHESSDIACTSCHTVMKDLTERHQLTKATVVDTCGSCHLRESAQQLRNSHMPVREGKMTCTSCHNPHGTVTPALLRENTLNDTCYRCHAEKRGPFLWEHPPVLESCANCHDPHGSNHEKMLKLAKPRLCQQCHNEQRVHMSSPYGRDTSVNATGNPTGGSQKFILGRSCSSCHPTVHGSNHPSGAAFTR